MTTFRMLLAEIAYRKLNFTLGLVAVTVAVTLMVSGPMLVEGYGRQTAAELSRLEQGVRQAADEVARSEEDLRAELARLEDETRKAMVGLGFNLIILHGATDMGQYWATGFPTHDMDQEFVTRLAGNPSLTMVNHVVGTLREKIEWEGRTAGLVGYLPEATRAHRRKQAPMGYTIEPGTVFLGHLLAGDRKEGDQLEVLGKQFKIAKVLPEMGSEEDNTIAMHLDDAQELLREGRKVVNQIMAIDCRCAEADLPRIRKQVADIVPECFVSRVSKRAAGRSRQRTMVREQFERTILRQKEDLNSREEHLAQTAARRKNMQGTLETMTGALTLLVAAIAAIWVGLLFMTNVRERITEIGVLRAIGKGSGTIATLFLGKAVLLGILGGAVGLVAGTGLGWILQVRGLGLPANSFDLPVSVLITAMVGAPLLAAIASYLPTLSALGQDPAVVLREP